MRSVTRECEGCKNHLDHLSLEFNSSFVCPHCSRSWVIGREETIFQVCPFCGCRQFYIQKDFHRAIGCVIVLIGIILVPMTYGVSLPIFAFFDWMLYKKVKDMVICYKCGTEFRGFSIPTHFKPFMHHIGVKYDKQTRMS